MVLDVNNKPKRYCEYCEDELPLSHPAKERFCDRGCFKKYENALLSVNHPEKVKQKGMKDCPICGEFIVNVRKRYCDECTKRITRLHRKKYNAEQQIAISKEVDKRKKYLASLSDEDFYNEVTKKLMENRDKGDNNGDESRKQTRR